MTDIVGMSRDTPEMQEVILVFTVVTPERPMNVQWSLNLVIGEVKEVTGSETTLEFAQHSFQYHLRLSYGVCIFLSAN